MELRKFIKTTIKEYLNEQVKNDGYQLSPRIVNNKCDEYITFKNVPAIKQITI